MDDAVDHRRSDGEVSEYVAPAGGGQVACHDHRGLFVKGRHELEAQVRSVLVERDVVDFVDLCRLRDYADSARMSTALQA